MKVDIGWMGLLPDSGRKLFDVLQAGPGPETLGWRLATILCC